jgi:6-phosphogluconolactonase (cycloisomerase 2 family)
VRSLGALPKRFLKEKFERELELGFAGRVRNLTWRRFMTMKGRALLVGIVMLAEMWLVGCGHYTCGATFGASSCAAGGGGLSNGNGSNTTGAVYLFVADAGGIQGEVLDPTAGTIKTIPGGTVSVTSGSTNAPQSDFMAVAQGKYMFSGYSTWLGGTIYGWSITGGGTLNAITGVQPLSAPYLVGNFQIGSQAMIANPAGTLLFALDQTNEQVYVYTIGTGGVLAPATNSPMALPSGFKPFNLAVDGLGKYLYVSNDTGLRTTEVATYSIGSNGALAAVGTPISSSIRQMQGDASGKFMIGTSGGFFFDNGDNTLYVGAIGQSGALTVTSTTITGVPAGVAVQPNTGGNIVYAFDFPSNTGNGTIEGFQFDLSTGALTAIAGITASGANGEFDPSGKYLFVVAASNGVASALDAYDVSASSALTTPVATVGWAPGAWQPVDAQ